MNLRKPSTRTIIHFTVALVIVIIGFTAIWAHRTRAGGEAARFAPADARVTLPAGTVISAAIPEGIAESAQPGDAVTAVVSRAVMVNGRRAIPTGAQLKGELENLSVDGPKAKAQIRFTTLALGDRRVVVETREAVAIVTVQSDVQIVKSALMTLMAATFGAAIGASTGDERLIVRGLLEGARGPLQVGEAATVIIVLAADLEV